MLGGLGGERSSTRAKLFSPRESVPGTPCCQQTSLEQVVTYHANAIQTEDFLTVYTLTPGGNKFKGHTILWNIMHLFCGSELPRHLTQFVF